MYVIQLRYVNCFYTNIWIWIWIWMASITSYVDWLRPGQQGPSPLTVLHWGGDRDSVMLSTEYRTSYVEHSDQSNFDSRHPHRRCIPIQSQQTV